MAKRTGPREREQRQERNVRDREMLRQLGGRVRGLRKKRGLSQEVLAERAGLTPKFLGEVERVETNPSVTSLARLADALAVNVGDLFEPRHEVLPVAATQMDQLHDAFDALGLAIQGLNSATDGMRRERTPRRATKR